MKSKQLVDTEENYYVGIGASAGGLEALQDFFKFMPEDTGMVFIVIQHLSPDYKSLMDELLARHTNMPINIASDGMSTKPNNIYLIPPKYNLSIFHGKLYLEEQKGDKKVLNLPIDMFFRALALDKGKQSIGIILSGTGSDGTLGIRAIKEAGGMVMVQDNQSAKFDGMPRSSVNTGLVDYVLPPSKMAEELINYVKHPFVKNPNKHDIMKESMTTINKITLLLREHSSVDFSYYKENTLLRRIERRISINRFETMEEYLAFLNASDKEKDILFRELLIGVTNFFRDKGAFNALSEKVLPELISGNKRTLRLWSAGCSTGEEVYSLAIIIQEYLDQNNLNDDYDIKIFATDIDRNALDLAGQGFYPEGIVCDVEPYLLSKYFTYRDQGYQVKDFLRKMIVFASHNILKDPPFSKLDLLVCRNLFIYLKPEMQQRLLGMFYYSLNPKGYLFLGSSESLGDMSEAFQPVDNKWKVYKYKANYKPPIVHELIVPTISHSQPQGFLMNERRYFNRIKMEKMFETVLSNVLPPSLIIDEYDNIVHVINNMNQFFDIKPGKFSSSVLHNLSTGLGSFVSNVLRKLKTEKKSVLLENIHGLKGYENKKLGIQGSIIALDDEQYYLLNFLLSEQENVGRKVIENIYVDAEAEVESRIKEIEKELQITKETLQATVEELETSNEELQSSNEELIASNEELQSTNEELQSVNEELYTVNSEYQIKIDELTRSNNDMNNLLRNTDVGALYLDRNLCIRKLTPVVTKVTNILPNDIGRPISHLSTFSNSSELLSDIEKVADELIAIEREIKDDHGLIWRVKINPYRTDYNAVEGILLTFVDIHQLKKEQNKLIEANNRLEQALSIGNMAWWEWHVETGRVIYDAKKATMLGYANDEFPDEVYEICSLIHPDDYNQTMKEMKLVLEGDAPDWESTYRMRRKDGSYGWYYDRGTVVAKNTEGIPTKIIGTVLDISHLKEIEEQLRNSKILVESILENSPIAKTMVDKEGCIIYANKKAEEIFNITREEILQRTFDASQWKITGIDGKDLDLEELPFSIIKKTQKSIKGYKHYIEVPPNQKILLRINGAPIFDTEKQFDGCVFALEEVEGDEDCGQDQNK